MRHFAFILLVAVAVGAGLVVFPDSGAAAQQDGGGYSGRNRSNRTQRWPEPPDSYSADPDISEIEELEGQCLDAVNRQRESRGLAHLKLNRALAPIAREYSRRMAEERFFDHIDPDGRTVRERVREAGVTWRVLGENLAFTRGYVNPVAASLRGWMDSAGHRRNILEPGFDESAVGAWISSNGTVYFTEIFIRLR
jgi:uncharacterized protein YkwD